MHRRRRLSNATKCASSIRRRRRPFFFGKDKDTKTLNKKKKKRFQSNLKVKCTESGHFIGEIAISHSRARNSINGTILRTKTGDDIVRMSVMMLNNNIFGPQPHLEDENCTREMRVRPKDFF